MHSIVSKDGKYIGQYLNIKNTKFSIDMFTKFYNLAISDNDFLIDADTTKGLIQTEKYCANNSNKIYVNNPSGNDDILKTLNIGDYMVFIQYTNKIYLLNEKEFNYFMNTNDYHSDDSTIYLVGTRKFIIPNLIIANNIETAKYIYRNRYNLEESSDIEDEPIVFSTMAKW